MNVWFLLTFLKLLEYITIFTKKDESWYMLYSCLSANWVFKASRTGIVPSTIPTAIHYYTNLSMSIYIYIYILASLVFKAWRIGFSPTWGLAVMYSNIDLSMGPGEKSNDICIKIHGSLDKCNKSFAGERSCNKCTSAKPDMAQGESGLLNISRHNIL